MKVERLGTEVLDVGVQVSGNGSRDEVSSNLNGLNKSKLIGTGIEEGPLKGSRGLGGRRDPIYKREVHVFWDYSISVDH